MTTPSSRRRAARVTSSRNRAARKPSSPKPVSTSKGRPARSRVSTAKVTESRPNMKEAKPSARVTSSDTSKLAQNRSVFEPKENPRITRGKGTPSGAGKMASAASKAAPRALALKGGLKAAVFKEGMTARNTGAGTMKGQPTGPSKGPAVPQRLTQSGINKKSFDDAFRQARKSGQKEFTWRGKRYNTKVK